MQCFSMIFQTKMRSFLFILLLFSLVGRAEAETPETAWDSGFDLYGQSGEGEIFESKSIPVQVNDLDGVIAIAGWGHRLALKSDGTVWTWGYNNNGQLGDGTFMTIPPYGRSAPAQVIGLDGVMAIAAGNAHSLALKSDGTVWSWGWNGEGELGDGTRTTKAAPVQVIGLNGVVAIAAGGFHNLALKSDGTIWAWGYNGFGQLGKGNSVGYTSYPVQVSGLNGVVAVAGGEHHSLALKSDGTVWTWGSNMTGQLGDGTNTDKYFPVQVNGLNGVISIAAWGYHSLTVKSDDTVWAWGYNNNGQLGDGITINSSAPVQVSRTPDLY